MRTSQRGWTQEQEQLELGQGGLGGVSGKALPPEGAGHWNGAPGNGHSSRAPGMSGQHWDCWAVLGSWTNDPVSPVQDTP